MARSATDLLSIVHQLERKSVQLRVVDQTIVFHLGNQIPFRGFL
ncbi:hypothetical protein H3S80_05490 [Bartonella sp. M0177]|nr:hypothetical protein [Bartonella sp. M0177]